MIVLAIVVVSWLFYRSHDYDEHSITEEHHQDNFSIDIAPVAY